MTEIEVRKRLKVKKKKGRMQKWERNRKEINKWERERAIEKGCESEWQRKKNWESRGIDRSQLNNTFKSIFAHLKKL